MKLLLALFIANEEHAPGSRKSLSIATSIKTGFSEIIGTY